MDGEPAQQEVASVTPKKAGGFVLTENDITILNLIYEFRFLRREHITALTGRHTLSVHRRLLKLSTAGYLAVIRLPQKKHIYALGKRALPILVEQGSASPELLLERLRTHEIKELFLTHEMMIVDLHVMLTLATRAPESDLRLIDWREGRELWDSVSFADHAGMTRLPVRADAMFALEDVRRPAGSNRINFFLEADRSTATQTRFKDKIRAYWHYREQGLHVKKFNVRTFRVLTVAVTEKRAENLCKLAASLLPEGGRKFCFFTSLQHFSIESPAAILGSVYHSARACDALEPLFPPLNFLNR